MGVHDSGTDKECLEEKHLESAHSIGNCNKEYRPYDYQDGKIKPYPFSLVGNFLSINHLNNFL